MLFYVLFSIDSRGLDHGNFLQQLRKYEFVTPQLHAHGRWKRDTSTQTNSVSDEPIPYSDIHSVCAISQLFPLTVVYFAAMNRIFFCGHIACICKNWFVNWRHHAVFNEKQYVKLTLRLGWSFGKNTFVLKGIWQRLHLGRRPKPVSRALKLPHSFEQSFGETFRLTVRLYHHTVLFLFLQNSALWHLFVKVFRWKWKRNCWKKRGKLIYFCF